MTRTATLHVDGMSCASCVARIEKSLAGLPGVRDVAANLAQSTVRATFDDPAPVLDALGRAGYPPREGEIVLSVEGMTCASCAGRVERALRAVPGVTAASVNLAAETAHVRGVEGLADPAALVAAIKGAGYAARPRKRGGDDAPGAHRAAEAESLRSSMLLAVALTLPVFVLEMGHHLFPAFGHWIHATIGMQTSRVIQFVLATAVLFGPGLRFFRHGFPALLRGAPDMNSLVAVGTSAAWGYSIVATFAPGLLPEDGRNIYFEAAAVIVALILLGRWLEARARGRTGAAIQRLLGLRARTALVMRPDGPTELAVEEVAPGDTILLRPGERVAVDGEVIEGSSWIDESMISGEPLPVGKEAGDKVIGGTVNGGGALTYRAVAVGADTVLAQIVRMVEEAQGSKLPIQALVDRVTLYFVPAVMTAAALTVLAWLVWGPDPVLTHALVAGVSVLIIACPCAMGLATPTSIMVGTGRAAEMGVLFRRGDALQALDGVAVVALDKTGTITEGRPEVTDLAASGGGDVDAVLRLVAAVEARSEHPLGAAILRAARARGLDLPEVAAFDSRTGMGVSASVEGRSLLVGAPRFLEQEGIALGALKAQADALAARGRTPVLAAIDGTVAAVFGIADPVKPTSRQAIAALRSRGLRVAMITGDARGTAEAIAAETGIDEVVAEVLPGGKVEAIRALRRHGPVAFVGDGINDAPALAEAEVGIAIGTGTDVAVESAEVVLMSGDLRGVVSAHEVSRRTLRNIRQNLFWAFGYNTALIPVAAGALYPAFGILLSPALAAGAMAMSSVCVLANALRLRRIRPAVEDVETVPQARAASVPAPAE